MSRRELRSDPDAPFRHYSEWRANRGCLIWSVFLFFLAAVGAAVYAYREPIHLRALQHPDQTVRGGYLAAGIGALLFVVGIQRMISDYLDARRPPDRDPGMRAPGYSPGQPGSHAWWLILLGLVLLIGAGVVLLSPP